MAASHHLSNGDGRPDVLIVNLAASTVTVLLNMVPEADVAGKLTVTPEPSTFPQSFSLNLSLHAAVPASAVPSGTVVFRLDGTPLGNAAISNGSASFLVNTQVPVGMHELTASYSGDSTFQPGTFAARHTVIPAVVPTPTATGLASAPNPAQVGTNVTFTASVTNTTAGTAASPSGNVTFSDGSTALGQSALNTNGVATFITNALAVGTHSITASYAGTTTTQPSVSSTVQQVIVAILGDFSLDVTSDTASIDTGAAQSFNVTVSAIGGFSQSVALSCSGLPSETTCVFKPASVPGGSGLSQLTIQTSSSHSIKAAGNSVPLPWKPLAATSASLSLAVLLLPRRTRVLRRYLTLVICLLLTVAMGACGGGSGPAGGGTPPGTYNVSINGTASSLTHSIPVALTVK
jgi:Bacterial Ig-like domain (group 3)